MIASDELLASIWEWPCLRASKRFAIDPMFVGYERDTRRRARKKQRERERKKDSDGLDGDYYSE